MHKDMIHVPVAFPTGIDDATHSSPAHLRELYSPKCVEGLFSEVALPLYGVLRSSPLAGASIFLPNPHPLAVASDDVGLISINGVGATAATHHILDCRNVSGLDEVVAATAVEAIH